MLRSRSLDSRFPCMRQAAAALLPQCDRHRDQQSVLWGQDGSIPCQCREGARACGAYSWVTRPFSHWMPVQGTGLPQGLSLRPDTPPDPVLASVMPGTPAAAKAASCAAMAAVTLLELAAPPSVTPQPMMKPLPAELALTQSVTGCRLDTAHTAPGFSAAGSISFRSWKGLGLSSKLAERTVRQQRDRRRAAARSLQTPGGVSCRSDTGAGSGAYGHRPLRLQGRRPAEGRATCRPWRTRLELHHGGASGSADGLLSLQGDRSRCRGALDEGAASWLRGCGLSGQDSRRLSDTSKRRRLQTLMHEPWLSFRRVH